jgi:hypothetical protein
MPEIVLFAGPTLPRAQIPGDVEVMPPVSQGDIARLVVLPTARRPRWIAIVDGVYERVPAVWHKEILWALSRGIWVGGAASMGALRAAELAPYGMAGVGQVYGAALSGELVDDDEVAVAHLGAEDDYRPVSVAMVDIRATLGAAVVEGVLSAGEAATLAADAKRRHYPDRRWPAIAQETPRLREWLRHGRHSVKADDARALIDLVRTRPEPAAVMWRLEETEQWRAVRPASGSALTDLPDDPDLQVAATLRLIAARHYPRPAGAALAEWVDRVRAHVPAAGLADLDDQRLAEFAADQAALVAACAEVEQDLPDAIADVLRLRGRYPASIGNREGENPPCID